MIALFDNVSVLHHQDDVRLPDGGETMRNDEAGSALHHGCKSILNLQLGAGIDG